MRTLIALSLGVALVVLNGCAHGGHVSGSVVMRHNDQEGHICIDGEKVKVGDQVSVFSTACKTVGGGRSARTQCTKYKAGDGQITEILDQHFATVKMDTGVVLREGQVVERH